jgi:hypothetical protein
MLKDMIEDQEEIAHDRLLFEKQSLEQTIESVNHNITKSKKI